MVITMFITKQLKTMIFKFTSMVTSNIYKSEAFFVLNFLAMLNECKQCFILMSKKINLCEPRVVINNDKSIRLATHAQNIHRSKQVNMQQFK